VPKTVFDPHDTDRFGNLDANVEFLADTGLLGDGIRVLEIGSGRGALLSNLRTRGVDVIGIEPDAALARDARVLSGPLPLVRMSGDRLGFLDATFDLVVSFDVFEHITDSDAHLSEVRRVLKPDGAYALQTPNKWTNSVFETIRWRSFTRWKAQHCALHSMVELQRRLEAHGFKPTFADVPVVNDFFREKLRRYLGPVGPALLAIVNPDKWPRRWRTNFYVVARLRDP
jgi:cyclopropane fatty-acyl-phospholipid synthase-like methyltransferase